MLARKNVTKPHFVVYWSTKTERCLPRPPPYFGKLLIYDPSYCFLQQTRVKDSLIHYHNPPLHSPECTDQTPANEFNPWQPRPTRATVASTICMRYVSPAAITMVWDNERCRCEIHIGAVGQAHCYNTLILEAIIVSPCPSSAATYRATYSEDEKSYQSYKLLCYV